MMAITVTVLYEMVTTTHDNNEGESDEDHGYSER